LTAANILIAASARVPRQLRLLDPFTWGVVIAAPQCLVKLTAQQTLVETRRARTARLGRTITAKETTFCLAAVL